MEWAVGLGDSNSRASIHSFFFGVIQIFFLRTIPDWNRLLQELVAAVSASAILDCFKSRLASHLKDWPNPLIPLPPPAIIPIQAPHPTSSYPCVLYCTISLFCRWGCGRLLTNSSNWVAEAAVSVRHTSCSYDLQSCIREVDCIIIYTINQYYQRRTRREFCVQDLH